MDLEQSVIALEKRFNTLAAQHFALWHTCLSFLPHTTLNGRDAQPMLRATRQTLDEDLAARGMTAEFRAAALAQLESLAEAIGDDNPNDPEEPA